MSGDAWQDVDDALARERSASLSPSLHDALLAFLVRNDRLYDGSRLRVGSDLRPPAEVCDRAVFYRLTGTPADPPALGRRLRYERGRMAERLFRDALRAAGHELLDEVPCRPLRPSAWAWDAGHGDVLDVCCRRLYEIKAPGEEAWARATGMPRRLVREAYRWQLSFYFHELSREGKTDGASWVFMDLNGDRDPVEVPLEGDLLVPLSQIVEVEATKARLFAPVLMFPAGADEPPPRPASTIAVTRVLKGGRAKKGETPQRKVTAVESRFWGCSFCDFLGACQPGPEETPVELAPDHPLRVAAIAEAERRWAAEDAAKKEKKVVDTALTAVGDLLLSGDVPANLLEVTSAEIAALDPKRVAEVRAMVTREPVSQDAKTQAQVAAIIGTRGLEAKLEATLCTPPISPEATTPAPALIPPTGQASSLPTREPVEW